MYYRYRVTRGVGRYTAELPGRVSYHTQTDMLVDVPPSLAACRELTDDSPVLVLTTHSVAFNVAETTVWLASG